MKRCRPRQVGSQRPDMLEFQRVAAIGIMNLASNYDLRALAAKLGALETVVKMLESPLPDVQR